MRRGSDLRYPLNLTLEQAVGGDSVEIRVPKLDTCPDCDGSGAAPGTSPTACPDCNGVGQIRVAQGFFSLQQTCPRCRGTGKVILNPCRTCGGGGRVERRKTLSVDIPAGVDEGNRIRLTGEGEAGLGGGPPGDLYVQISIEEHDIFKREGRHLFCDVPISFVDAALGAEIEVPTLNGRVNVRVPAETQTGKLFRLRGRGVPALRGGASGDLLCRMVLETPVRLSDTQKDLLRQFKESLENGGSKHAPRGNLLVRLRPKIRRRTRQLNQTVRQDRTPHRRNLRFLGLPPKGGVIQEQTPLTPRTESDSVAPYHSRLQGTECVHPAPTPRAPSRPRNDACIQCPRSYHSPLEGGVEKPQVSRTGGSPGKVHAAKVMPND